LQIHLYAFERLSRRLVGDDAGDLPGLSLRGARGDHDEREQGEGEPEQPARPYLEH
jgi:hypothetical protein